jgi:predicted aldo/keto reductase-like oxidoreductase
MNRRYFFLSAGGVALSAAGCVSLSKQSIPKGSISVRPLGRTDIKVSRFGFGSHLKNELIANPRLRDRMIKTGFAHGITTFDVYDHRGYKQFEPMGKSIIGFRKEIVISLCIVKPDEEIQGEIDGALRTFHSDFIDLYRTEAINDDRINTLEKNKKAGKIRAIGVVTHDANEMMKHIDRYDGVIDYVMIVYNFHHNIGRPKKGSGMPPNDYSALIPRCKAKGLGILGIKPMGSDDMVDFALRNGYYTRKGPSLSHAMLRHVFDCKEIDCAMNAMNTMAELASNLDAAYHPSISQEEDALLAGLSRDADSMRAEYLSPKYRWLENWRIRVV